MSYALYSNEMEQLAAEEHSDQDCAERLGVLFVNTWYKSWNLLIHQGSPIIQVYFPNTSFLELIGFRPKLTTKIQPHHVSSRTLKQMLALRCRQWSRCRLAYIVMQWCSDVHYAWQYPRIAVQQSRGLPRDPTRHDRHGSGRLSVKTQLGVAMDGSEIQGSQNETLRKKDKKENFCKPIHPRFFSMIICHASHGSKHNQHHSTVELRSKQKSNVTNHCFFA